MDRFTLVNEDMTSLTYSLNFLEFGLLLLNCLLSTNLFTFIHSGTCCFFNHSKDLKEEWQSVKDLNSRKMYEEVRAACYCMCVCIYLWWLHI